MDKPQYHILVCNSFRVSGEPLGICNKKGASDLLGFLEGEIIDRDLDALVSSTSCMKACGHGPVVVIYPQGWWYGEVDEDRMEQILDALEDDEPVEELLM